MSQTQDLHYEEKIFPLTKEGKDKFNWWAGLLGFYWFPYKGLWKEWLIYEIVLSLPLSFLMAIEHPQYPNFSLLMKALTALLCGVLIVFLGNMGNSFYLKSYEKIAKKSVIWRGVVGTILAIALSFPETALAEFLMKSLMGYFL